MLVITGALVGALVGGLITYFVARWQINQARQDAALDLQIDSRVDSKLQAVKEDIAKLREDVAYVKAKVEDATTKKIVGFSKLSAAEITANLPALSAAIAEANRKQLIAPPQAVAELRNKLAQVQARNPQFWTTVSNIVNFQSLTAEKLGQFPNAEKIRDTPCGEPIYIHGRGRSAVNGFALSSCTQHLDNVLWSNGTFQNMIIIYNGGPMGLQNVTFKNCLFLVSFPVTPTSPAQKLGEALLAGSGQLPSFTVSTG